MSSSTGTPSAPTFKAGRNSASSLEPSPASTYGDSASSNAGDDDYPQTPGDEGVPLSSKMSELSVHDGKATARYSPPFVRNGSKSKVEDPFTSPQHRSGQRTPTGPKHQARSSKSGNWRSGSSSGSGSGKNSPSAGKFTRIAPSGRGVLVQEYASESGEMTTNEQVIIKSEDAQAIFPPSSCVFVANLLQSENDEALEVAVTQIFREYGTVYVKIRRDNDADAERAIKEGRGRLVKGRPCRCEKAKAHRLFFFERKYGGDVTASEVQHLLRPYGRISFCRMATDVERSAFDLNGGVLVQFAMYDEGQAAHQAFRNHSEYKMQCMANIGSKGPGHKSDPANRSYLDTYEVDKRSVFVGNLPTDVTEDDLKDLFHQCGDILRVTVHKNDSTIDFNQKHCFAFVEFYEQPSVSRALATMQGYLLRARALRVAQKDTEAAKNRTRRQPSRAAPVMIGSFQSPAPRAVSLPNASPMAQMSPTFASPYGFPYYGYPGAIAQGPAQYYSPQYSPSPFSSGYNFAYTGSPACNNDASTASTATGSPTQTQYYYANYSPYASPAYASPAYASTAYTSPTYWSTPSTVAAQQPVSYYMQPYSAPATADIVLDDDRSATPTPAGQSSVAETSLESE
ncbi:hypothetical protein VTL71DRAFT_3110 [Oculimacula yallundae]|uniref:RRM domain-containing protein n=1 Tax=Oculimacula yallundae TaxID=86028 RepID=A0ABR4C6W5_9HELO